MPLIKFNADMSGGQVMQDMSPGARHFLQRNRYTAWREKWMHNHPFLRDHPDQLPKYLREKAAQRGEHVRVERDLDSSSLSRAAQEDHQLR